MRYIDYMVIYGFRFERPVGWLSSQKQIRSSRWRPYSYVRDNVRDNSATLMPE